MNRKSNSVPLSVAHSTSEPKINLSKLQIEDLEKDRYKWRLYGPHPAIHLEDLRQGQVLKGKIEKEDIGKKGALKEIQSSSFDGAYESLEANISVMNTCSWIADPKKLVIGAHIQSGTYGSVHKATYDGHAVAVKMLDWGRANDVSAAHAKFLRDAFAQEVLVWCNLRHSNVCQFVGAILGDTEGFRIPKAEPGEHVLVDGHVCCLILEFLSGGTLKKYLMSHHGPKLPYKTVIRLALDISRGLAYLHYKSIVHRDVKSENILLDKHKTAKIADFGVSRVEPPNASGLKHRVGTVGYMAPEVLQGIPYDHKVDVFSFGILLWEIYCCDNPFPDMDLTIENVRSFLNQGWRPDIPHCCPPDLKSLMEMCWDKNPSLRPDMTEVVRKLEGMDIKSEHRMEPDLQEIVQGSNSCTIL